MIKDFISYFYPNLSDEENGLSKIEQKFKAKIIVFSLLSLITFLSINLILFITLLGVNNPANIGILIFIPFLFLSLMSYKVLKSTILYEVGIIFIATVILPARAFELQSHAWSLVIWVYFSFILISYTINTRVAAPIILVNILSVSYNIYYGQKFSGYLPTELQIIINFILPICFLGALLYYKIYTDRQKMKEVRDFERNDTISKMVIVLAHEISNPLTIAKLSTDILHSDYNSDLLLKIDSSLDRLSDISSFINNIEDLKEGEHSFDCSMSDRFESLTKK